jgi:preprotein translocase subunit SecA
MAAATGAIPGSAYPERDEPRESKLEKAVVRARYFSGAFTTSARHLSKIVAATDAQSAALRSLSDDEIKARAAQLRPRLRREGWHALGIAGEAFALVREASGRTIGMRHFESQLIGGWAMLNGMIAEMETGEGKTLTATLAAATAGLAARAVHVITVNDYLAERDADIMRPVYEFLGLTVGFANHDLSPQQKQAIYDCDVAYCSNKEIAFDYLRDRMILGGKPRPIGMKMDALDEEREGRRLMLRGLQFAIVDEADSVLVDEARTPLILSAEGDNTQAEELHRQALDIAGAMTKDDWRRREEGIELTAGGKEKLEEMRAPLGGLWSGPRRSEQMVRQALTALHVFERDKHYLVRDDKVQIIDEYTGRLMPDRSWEHGLHQLIEMKEGCTLTGSRETLARISYQRFFRRYLHLCGMTGTAEEVAPEMWSVYRLRVSDIPTHKPVRRTRYTDQVYGKAPDKWQAVLDSIRRHHGQGRPVLVGTRSVAASEHLATLLDAAKLPYKLLNARQDKEEADIVARAGEPGSITVATNMAGRGTDIKLLKEVSEAGGLHVIATELHDSARVDRQLFGRCGRQGDRGSCEAILAVEEELVTAFLKPAARYFSRMHRLPPRLGAAVFRLAQWRAERNNSRIRKDLLDMDDYLGDLLAFAGRGE